MHEELLYLGGNAYSAPAVYKKENNMWNIYYICRDYLGSITHITNSAGTVVQELDYDAWGRLRNPQTLAIYTGMDEPVLFLGRGFTGHEHLRVYKLINMNARLYDPVTGRFLSPDPYIQAPDFTQNFNRYSYALNNPLKYTDPDGEYVIGFISGFFRGLFQGKNPFKTGHQAGMNELKIWRGLFAADTSQRGWGWQIVSRLTWQLPQTIAGLAFSHVSNWGWQVDKVDYWGGATALSGNFFGSGGAVTLGSYINGGPSLKADPHNPLFQHEYGHYLQSQEMGWAYLTRVGIPSILSKGDHDFHPVEQDANRRAFLYFNENFKDFKNDTDWWHTNYQDNQGWDYWRNPLNIDGTGTRGQYYDYYGYINHQAYKRRLDNLRLSPKWYDYASWLLFPIGPIGVGLINTNTYNK